MDEPTKEVIVHALENAKQVLSRNPDMSLATALAHATTTEQCRGFQGFAVYRDVRAAVGESGGLNAKGAANFTENARGAKAVSAVDDAIKWVSK